jgi:type II secretory pathway component PulK
MNHRTTPSPIQFDPARRGAILVVAMWIMIILVSVVLVLARSMRVEGTAAANRQSLLEAVHIERGAEQFVLAQVDGSKGDAVTVLSAEAEAMPLGNGYFWILRPDPETDQSYGFGITDEASKLNLNVATSDQLQYLPAVTSDVADAIVDWRDADDVTGQNGAESDYYLSLSLPYTAKNLPFETVEELQLIKGMTKELLFGYDLNRDGVLDQYEQQAGGSGTGLNSASSDSRGFFNYVTAWSAEPNTAADGSPRTNVNSQNTAALQKVLAAALPAKRVTQILAKLGPFLNPARNNPAKPVKGATSQPTPNAFANIGAFYLASGMTATEFGLISDKVTTSTAKIQKGLININTAPKQVLLCLPGLDAGDADAIVGKRLSGADTTGMAWAFDLLTPAKVAGMAGQITSRSFFYSADIVGVSGDGRSYKRVRIVIDAQKSPAKVIYRRDLTSFGWPLDRQIQDDLRSGHYVPTVTGNSSGFGSGSGGSLTR